MLSLPFSLLFLSHPPLQISRKISMAPRLRLIVFIIFVFISFCTSRTNADAAAMGSAFSASISASSSPAATPSSPPEDQDTWSPTILLEPILTNLGFQELAMAAPSLSDSAYTTWNGPTTLFAPTDASIRTCGSSCSVPQLLREHMVPGIFSIDYLRKLAFGTKLETMSQGRCVTVTSAFNNNTNSKIMFVGGVEITHPDLFYNGLIVVHRLEGFISPLSPFSCNVERMNSLSFPPQPPMSDGFFSQSLSPPSTIMNLMLRDAMLRLHNNGFSVLSLALRVKYAELMSLQNMTIFALDDASIFSGGHAYLSNFRFHVVPNRLLMHADLMRLPAGKQLATLDRGQALTVTTAGTSGAQMRINYVRIKVPDVVYNLKIVVHSVFLPFPRLQPATVDYGSMGSGYDATAVIGNGRIIPNREGNENVPRAMGSCPASEDGNCAQAPSTKI